MTTAVHLRDLLAGDPYRAYSYSYPHKTSYRRLDPPVDLRPLWQAEKRSALFLYLHVPFCEMRCGFCNLFTRVQAPPAAIDDYLSSLERQADAVQSMVGDARWARLAVGGGTPTFLDPPRLRRLLAIATKLGAGGMPSSVEASAATIDAERLAVLKDHRITRISIGVQSLSKDETTTLRRRQDPQQVLRVLDLVAQQAFPIRNVDLMYGISGQTPTSFRVSIDMALAHGANELYLYPLYIRPLTILGKAKAGLGANRLELYRSGRDHLRSRGWQQLTMRMFRAPDLMVADAAGYRCQEDGMVGLGIGARSYTRTLHYSSEYAVDQGAIRRLIADWSRQSEAAFAVANHGIVMDDEDRRRRYLILCLLEAGLDRAAYHSRFGDDVMTHVPELEQALELGLADTRDSRLFLTEKGIEASDVIGQWLYSPRVRQLMESYQAQ